MNGGNWIVRCRVSGGVTGTRESVLKNGDGAVKYFATEDAARDEATRLQTERDSDRYRTAFFQYWPSRAVPPYSVRKQLRDATLAVGREHRCTDSPACAKRGCHDCRRSYGGGR